MPEGGIVTHAASLPLKGARICRSPQCGSRPGLAVTGDSLRRRREGRRAEARAQLRTAHGMFAAIGMQAFAERARRELLATGETVRRRTADTHDQLTPQEAQIARLAQAGMSHPEIAPSCSSARAPSSTTWPRS